ncbi:cytochrome c oxidase subunit II [Pseudokineococcus marinus]|uniref:cytochrome-c oxidase n=1 Tax=Pseudokineococcus marinus TaxID=351215 RepID=A0A849BJZ5_9ACTN|nr:cytochrome c oxidase subunit II [Pseudokineococcus marinus]NNH22941.1 cytochrome c oxidase subunit II [Pseudokineococcus marinus]
MRPTATKSPRRRALALLGGTAATALLTAGCSAQELSTGWLPSTRDTTDETGRIITLWNGSWIAALAVGVLVWGLTLWVVVAYRRRKDEVGLPAQLRYNVPLEILYTVVPLMMVGVLFYYTYRDQTEIEALPENPDVNIGVVGKQWAWDFNYEDEDVYETSTQVDLDEQGNPISEIPTLYLPVDQTVQFTLTSRDVIHSFWVPGFLYKKDMIPGRENLIALTPQQTGVFEGKCAELCGQYHSEMLFRVAVVEQDEFDAQMDRLRAAGQTGQLGSDLDKTTSDGTIDAVDVPEDEG